MGPFPCGQNTCQREPWGVTASNPEPSGGELYRERRAGRGETRFPSLPSQFPSQGCCPLTPTCTLSPTPLPGQSNRGRKCSLVGQLGGPVEHLSAHWVSMAANQYPKTPHSSWVTCSEGWALSCVLHHFYPFCLPLYCQTAATPLADSSAPRRGGDTQASAGRLNHILGLLVC